MPLFSFLTLFYIPLLAYADLARKKLKFLEPLYHIKPS